MQVQVQLQWQLQVQLQWQLQVQLQWQMPPFPRPPHSSALETALTTLVDTLADTLVDAITAPAAAGLWCGGRRRIVSRKLL